MKLPDQLQFIANAYAKQKRTGASLAGKVCVITGTTSGVGYAVAKYFSKDMAKIVMVCRDKERGEKVKSELYGLSGIEPDMILADFRSLEEVRRAAGEILAICPRIDILINNAGVFSTRLILNEVGVDTVLAVNHLASFLMTRLLIPRMAESAHARILQVNSEGHRFSKFIYDDIQWKHHRYSGYRSCGSSKTAQLLTVWKLDQLLSGTGITINAMHPGAVKSNIGHSNGLLYTFFSRVIITPFLKDPTISAQALHYLAAAPELETVSGYYYNLTTEEQPAQHASLGSSLIEEAWKISSRLVGLPEDQD
ncbi:MAG: SDR family NAD(P)-dependent oxidoreductase [Spirochaetia bacterium]|nr:SDR family NAD(P)-dependent oxidoreductase [Spirochaetia bacterium]